MVGIKTGIILIMLVLVVSAGCITAAKNAYHDYKATPTPTPTPKPTPTPLPTPLPTPAPVVTASNEEMLELMGGRSEGGWLSWYHPNASGLKDLLVHVTVYGHRFEPSYHWWSVSWAQYFKEEPAAGKKFLFIYVNMWMDDASDPRMWGMEENHFVVQVGQDLYYPDTGYQKQLRIKELEEVFDYNNVVRIQPYGYFRTYDSGAETAIPYYWLHAGKNNAWDGFIIYQIPKNATTKNIKVLGRFDNFAGNQWWQLV